MHLSQTIHSGLLNILEASLNRILCKLCFFSQAIVVDRTVYVSGCVGLDKDTGKLVDGGVVPETIQVLKNLKAVLDASGSSVEQVVKATIFVEDLGDFAKVNEEYKKGNCTKFDFFSNVLSCLFSYLFNHKMFYYPPKPLIGLSHIIM